jgi:hypothetical protein
MFPLKSGESRFKSPYIILIRPTTTGYELYANNILFSSSNRSSFSTALTLKRMCNVGGGRRQLLKKHSTSSFLQFNLTVLFSFFFGILCMWRSFSMLGKKASSLYCKCRFTCLQKCSSRSFTLSLFQRNKILQSFPVLPCVSVGLPIQFSGSLVLLFKYLLVFYLFVDLFFELTVWRWFSLISQHFFSYFHADPCS